MILQREMDRKQRPYTATEVERDGARGWQYLSGSLIYPFLNNDMNISLRWPLTLRWKSQRVPAILKPWGFNYSSIIPLTIFFHHRAI